MNNLSQITNYERETIINYNQDTQIASIYTYDSKLIRQLDRCCKQFSEQFKFIKTDNWEARCYECPKKYISIRMPKVLTESQKIAAIDRAKKMRESKNLNINSTV